MPFPVEERFIRATEEELGVRFPASFVAKMLNENGGEVEFGPPGSDWCWQLFPFLDSSDKKRLRRTCNDIVRETEASKKWLGFPPNAVAIGSMDADRLVLLPKTERVDELDHAVYWWDHETGDVEKIADDFSEVCG